MDQSPVTTQQPPMQQQQQSPAPVAQFAHAGAVEANQRTALNVIREFLKSKTSFDVLPVSYRLIVLDTSLLVKRALNVLLQNSVVSAPLWNSKTSKFAGLLTASDFLNIVHYAATNPDQTGNLSESMTLDSLANIGSMSGSSALDTCSIHPFRSLYDACVEMIDSSARRIPLIDRDEETQREIVVSVLTQYRILKFVSMNCRETKYLLQPLRDLKIGTSTNLCHARLNTTIGEVINLLIQHHISSVPVLDDDDKLINVYEAVDLLALIKGGVYADLSLTVGEALLRRSDDFEGVYTCTLADSLYVVLETIRKSRLHRLFVLDSDGKLLGVMTLGDILKYILFSEG
jgi:5'-AMP-activated protein kinase regulatory gamma subunit